MIGTNKKDLAKILLSIFSFSFLVYFIFLYYSMGDRPWIFYNSDSIYLPYLYGDLFFRKGHILQWIFSPVPYFFPDTFLYFVLATVTQDLRTAILLFAYVQLALYYILIVAIGNEVMGKVKSTTIFHLSVFISLALVATGYLQQETLNLGLVSQTHFSTALMFLIGVFLILKTFSSKNKIYYFWLFLSCFLTTCSDVLFVTQFVIVSLLSLGCMLFLARSEETEQKNFYTMNIFLITIASTFSYVIYQHSFFFLNMTTILHPIKRYAIADLSAASERIYHNFLIFHHNNVIVSILLLLFFLSALLCLTKIIYCKLKNKNVYLNDQFVFTIFMLFISIVIGLMSLLVLDNNLMVNGYYGMRHCLPLILFPVFLGIPLFLTQYTNCEMLVSKCYVPMVIVIVMSAYLVTPPGSIDNIVNFYPPSVACLDKIAEKNKLKDGITDFYWTSRSYSFLSKHALNIAVIAKISNTGFVPRRWFNTLNDYVGKDFRFYINNSRHQVDTDTYHPLDNAHIQETIGRPILQFVCPSWETGKFDYIYVYDQNKINIDFNYRESA